MYGRGFVVSVVLLVEASHERRISLTVHNSTAEDFKKMDVSTLSAAAQGTSSAHASSSTGDILGNLELGDFLKLMITELQNQDPLNPMENNEILATISQIQEIGATTKLNETLDAVLFGQSITSASSLLGKEIRALDNDGERVTGKVDKVTITDGDVQVHIGDQTVKLSNVTEIFPDE